MESQLFVYWKSRKFEAYWRAARASLHLDLCRNGIDFCDAGLEHASSCQQDEGPVDPNNEKSEYNDIMKPGNREIRPQENTEVRGHQGSCIFITVVSMLGRFQDGSIHWEISHLNCLARLADFRPKDGDLQKLRATCAEKLAGQQQRQGAVGGVGQA